jgi:hypothetical protein
MGGDWRDWLLTVVAVAVVLMSWGAAIYLIWRAVQ